MIPREDKQIAVELIDRAVSESAPLKKACSVLEISVSTYRRWKKGALKDMRQEAEKHIPWKLTEEEERTILDISCSKEYKDKNPYEIHASLLDKGIYIASVRSFYRVLNKYELVKQRTNTRVARNQTKPPQRIATGPNQVWTWDITWIRTRVQGLFYYAYVIIDIWDRSIVNWSIHDREDETLAHELFQKALRDNSIDDVLYIHSDNGHPMKGVTLAALFQELGIMASRSRPRVSDDNPFIESWFKTMKYSISYPGKFMSIDEARNWFGVFVHLYNTEHQHSGLNYMTPEEVRKGFYRQKAELRNMVMREAKRRHPQRWKQPVKQIAESHIAALNPTAETRLKLDNNEPIMEVG